MKSIHIIFIIITSVGILSSCKEKLESPNFDVTATVDKIKVLSDDGNTEIDAYEVEFLFSGKADNIVFYSGEAGAEYQYRNRYYRDDITTRMHFNTAYSDGDIPNTLRVMVSNDFQPEFRYSGSTVNQTVYTRAAVEAATWMDITNRFNLPGNELTIGTQTSGEAVIGEFHHELPFFIGFRFDADKTSDESLTLGQWVFSNFQIRNESEDGTSSFYINDVLDANWKKVEWADSTGVRVNNNTITMNGNVTTAAGKTTAMVKTMVISRPFYPSHVTPDIGTVIKTIDINLTEHVHTYIAPTVESVKATFVATNSLYGENIQEVKELEIVFEGR